MTKEIQITNTKTKALKKVLKFEICHYFVICALTFVIILILGCAQGSKDQAQRDSSEPESDEFSSSQEELKEEL